MKFENKARIVFYTAILVVFILGGWVLALVCFFGWLIPYSVFMGIRMIAIYGNTNWGPGASPHDPVTPREMNRK